MFSITLLLIFWSLSIFGVLGNNLNVSIVSGICGYPGEPLSAQHNVGNQRIFKSGDIVSYQCVDFLGYKQERICSNGQWVGPQARCGYAKNNDVKRVVVKDCVNGETVAEFKQLKLEKNFDRFVNSLSIERYNEKPIRALNANCLQWHLHLAKISRFQLVRADLATVFDGVSKSSKEVPVVTPFVTKNKASNLCQIEAMKQYKHIYTNKWINYGYKYHFYFSCLINNKSTETQNVFIIETVTKVALVLDLVRFSVAEVYGSPSDPACGRPETPVGVTAKPIREYQLYELFCDEPYFTNTTRVAKTQMVCNSNAFWSGSYPFCKPRMSCSNAHTFKTNSKALIKSIENVFYYNKTLWYAIDGTVINYQCGGQGSENLNIKSKKCLSNGLWDTEMCDRIDEQNNEWTVKPAQSSPEPLREYLELNRLIPIYAMVAFTSLIVITIAISALVIIWRNNSNNRKEYNDPNKGSPAQSECNENKCEVIGWTDRIEKSIRPITTNTYLDENQSIYYKQYEYQSDAIYDVPPNNTQTIPITINRDTVLEQNVISEPIYDEPKNRYP